MREGGALRSYAPFWQPRYYDFNVFREQKLIEKLDYMHQNPVQRGLVARPEDWKWSSALHYSTGKNAAWRLNPTGQRVAVSNLACIRWSAAAMSAKNPALSQRTREGQGTRFGCGESLGQPPPAFVSGNLSQPP